MPEWAAGDSLGASGGLLYTTHQRRAESTARSSERGSLDVLARRLS